MVNIQRAFPPKTSALKTISFFNTWEISLLIRVVVIGKTLTTMIKIWKVMRVKWLVSKTPK
ncbi:hypothetical protein AWI81_14600 [Listeria monocytogenes]|nr:hypothetical protein AWI81_14600 [Listeria monocytogenes]